MIKKTIALIAGALCLMASIQAGAAQDNNWKLLETTTYGAGGFWENGETVRIDRSFRAGTFSYERKVTAGESLSVYSTKGTFSSLKAEYAPGETVSVKVSLSQSGDVQAAPSHVYARVTLLEGDPGWTRANWSSKKIAASGSVAGQLTSSGGSYLVTPAGVSEMTLAGTVPASGDRMAIVFSCNGMDVLHLYGREAGEQEAAVAEVPVQQIDDTPRPVEEAAAPDKTVQEEKPAKQIALPAMTLEPKMKYLVLGALLLLAILDIIFMFSKPRKK